MDMNKGIVTVIVVGSLTGICGCRKEGPAERAGKDIDKAVEKIGAELGKADDRMGELIKKIGRWRPPPVAPWFRRSCRAGYCLFGKSGAVAIDTLKKVKTALGGK